MAVMGVYLPPLARWISPLAAYNARYGPVFPRTPANYGFTIIAKVKPGQETAIRAHGAAIGKALKAAPNFLAPLKLHFLKSKDLRHCKSGPWISVQVGSALKRIPPKRFYHYAPSATVLLSYRVYRSQQTR